MRSTIVVVSVLLFSSAAAEEAGVLTYEIFETAIAHVNLDECPSEIAAEGVFCRMTMNNDAKHVFAFSEAEQTMVAIRSYYMDQMSVDFD